MIERYRDLIIIYEGDMAFVISCDSLGAIGSKKHDVLKVDEDIVGKATIKVALAEALCIGAKPIVISDTLAVEMKPTGEKILRAIQEELEENGLDSVVLTGSTEENFPTSMTGIGITVVSKAQISDLKIKKVKKNMHVSLLGYPMVGDEVLNSDEILQLKDYVQICHSKEIVEAIPVGSKGIAYELGVLEKVSDLRIDKESLPHIDMKKSAGPSSCCILVHRDKRPTVIDQIGKPFTYIGKLV